MTNEEVVEFFATRLGYSFAGATAKVAPSISENDRPYAESREDSVPSLHASPVPTQTSLSVSQIPEGMSRHTFSTQVTTSACDALLKECLRRGSADNMSVLLIIPAPQNSNQVLLSQSDLSIAHSSNLYVENISTSQSTSGPTLVEKVAPASKLDKRLPPPPPQLCTGTWWRR